ncbi:putative phage tail protein [Tetrasphaera phage TJE1]|uniref:Putative phage tail protein n=1 Tax=Tetrasphaera phage TJE1 TaxID=981335 RepID=G4W968_9CAUD|nr:putative phage tail protein [Tetrasphaera phage TJE1]ADX42556.1 putative phage tail protein [Tetrasphaera phage TJE1]
MWEVFFASLALTTDENSFKKGLGILNSFANLGKTGVAGVVGLGAAFVALGASTANSMTKLDATAKQLGMNAMVLDNWQNAVRLAGGDADSFTASLMTMNEAFRNLKIGEVKEDFIKATGMSGADFSKLQSMNNDQRLRTIWSALEKVQDPGKQQALIQKIFGQGGVELFTRLQLQRRPEPEAFSMAADLNTVFQNLKNTKEGKTLQFSDADIARLRGIDRSQAIGEVWSRVSSIQDQKTREDVLEKILGTKGAQQFAALQKPGRRLADVYTQAAAMNPNTQQDYDVAVAGNQAQNDISVSFANIVKKLGIEIEEALLPELQKFAKWLKDNKQGFSDFAQGIGNVTTVLVGLINGLGGVIGNITGWFGEAEKKQKYLEHRKMKGLDMTNSQLSLLYGAGNENEYYKKFAAGELTIDQINKIDASQTRFNLFKAGKVQLAYALPDSVISAIAQKAASMAQGLYPGLKLSERDPQVASLQNIVLKEAVQKAEILLKIDGSKPLTKAQNDQIIQALQTAGILSVRK